MADAPDRALPDVEVLDVFVVDDSGELVSYDPAVHRDAELPTLDLRSMGDDVVRQLREFRAAPGARPGVPLATIVRSGHREEICQPVLVPPVAARQLLLADVLLADTAQLAVDRTSAASTATR